MLEMSDALDRAKKKSETSTTTFYVYFAAGGYHIGVKKPWDRHHFEVRGGVVTPCFSKQLPPVKA